MVASLNSAIHLPRLVARFPLHLEHLARVRDVAEQLLEVHAPVPYGPYLVNVRKERDGAVEEVVRMLYVPALELHFGVGEPELDGPNVDVERSYTPWRYGRTAVYSSVNKYALH